MVRSDFVTIAFSLLYRTSGHPIHYAGNRNLKVGSFVLEQTLHGHGNYVNSVAYNHDGSRLASGSEDSTIKIWNMEDGGVLLDTFHTINFKNTISSGYSPSLLHVLSVAYNHDGSRLASGYSDNTIRIWNMEDDAGTLLHTLNGHTDDVNSVAYNHDGSRIVSGSSDKTVRIWNMDDSGKLLHTLMGHKNDVNAVAYRHDGLRIASGCGDIKVWNTQGINIMTILGHNGWINSVAYNHDGSRLVSGSDDKTVKVWNMEERGALLDTFKGHNGPVMSVAYNHDGSSIVSGSEDHTAKIWSGHKAIDGHQTLEGHTYWVSSVAFNNDGLGLVTGSLDKTINVWKHVCPPGTASVTNNTLQCELCLQGTYQTNEGQVKCMSKNPSIAKGLGVTFGVIGLLWFACYCIKYRRELRTYIYYMCSKPVNEMTTVEIEAVLT